MLQMTSNLVSTLRDIKLETHVRDFCYFKFLAFLGNLRWNFCQKMRKISHGNSPKKPKNQNIKNPLHASLDFVSEGADQIWAQILKKKNAKIYMQILTIFPYN